MRKRTLNQTWTLCLRMWRKLAERGKLAKRRIDGDNIDELKKNWLVKNGFAYAEIKNKCFFCDYTVPDITSEEDCSKCPGALVDPLFDCTDAAHYYRFEPDKFYKELLRLNRIRKDK